MIYGIDLGTTMSGVSNEFGLIQPLKTSSVDGHENYKVNMAIDLQEPILLSAKLLRSMTENIKETKDYVISVPAYFKQSQREAVIKAGELAGINVVGLINEPTAAILACDLLEENVEYVVLDLGGGTYDISLIELKDGKYNVLYTGGEAFGGKDIDDMIVEELQAGMSIAEKMETKDDYLYRAKMGKEHQTLSDSIMNKVCDKVVTRLMVTTMSVIANLKDLNKAKFIFVGGSFLHPKILEAFVHTFNIQDYYVHKNLDELVCRGVGIYASRFKEGILNDVTSALSIKKADGTLRNIIENNSTIPCVNTYICELNKSSRYISLELYQGRGYYADEDLCIGTMTYDYGKEVSVEDSLLEVKVEVNTDGLITLTATELLSFDAEPRVMEIKQV